MAFEIRKLLRLARKLKQWWDDRQHAQSHQGEPAGHPHHAQQQPPLQSNHPHHQHQNQGQVNAQNPHYVGLRNQAIEHSKLMKQKFDEAHRAHSAKEGARAKTLSNEGKEHQRRRDELNKEAAEWIFRENNLHSPKDTIDLHGLYVQESIGYTETFIKRASKSSGPRTLRVIVGKGLHSQNNEAKLKPAIEKLVVQHNLAVSLDPHNAGVLVLQLGVSQDQRGVDGRVKDTLGNRNNDGCSIM